MSTPVDCTVVVDGWRRLADGHPTDADDAPTALSGLSVTWGRGTTVDQVEPSTCTFDVMDPPDGGSFMDLLHLGGTIDVFAGADVPVADGQPVNLNGDFEATPAGSPLVWTNLYSGARAVVTSTRAHSGANSATITSTPPSTVSFDTGVVPPAPPSSDPSAWDDIPVVLAGTEWTQSAWLYPSIGGQLTIQDAFYPSPTAVPEASRYGPRVPVVWDPANPWQAAEITYTADYINDGTWLGLGITVDLAEWSDIKTIPDVAWSDAPGTWAEWGQWFVDDIAAIPPAATGTGRRDVLVFSGRITDMSAGWDDGPGTVVVSVTAADFTADLAQRDVAADPWPAEKLSMRFQHVLQGGGVLYTRYQIDPTLADWRVTYMDVDRQPVWPLLADLATSVDGVLWSATHRTTGPYLWLADPRTQSALYILYVGDDGLVHVAATSAGGRTIGLDACDVLLSPVDFRQSNSDVTTRVAVSWQEQTTDDAGQPAPTDRTTTVVDAAAEVAMGTRRAAVSTVLTLETDATAVANLLLGRLHLGGWRLGGLTWRTDTTDMNPGQTGRVLDLLDGTRRLAAPIVLENLPPWAPGAGAALPLLLQGGQYAYEDGQWTLNLTTSSAAAQGTSLPWTDLDPEWAWLEFAPDVAWSDLVGVAGNS